MIDDRLSRIGNVQGYALIAALILLVLASLAVTAAVGKAQVDAQREREADLLFVGDEYRRALLAYSTAPGVPPQFPEKLEDLLQDHRFASTRRYLRRLYPDPLDPAAAWVLERSGGRIVGLHSQAPGVPLKHGGFAPADAAFAKARSYAEWRFSAVAAASP
jgi:type II secretory pathway pseudopilin PulG